MNVSLQHQSDYSLKLYEKSIIHTNELNSVTMEQTSNLFNILYSQNYEYVGVTDEDILKIIQEQILTLLSHKHEYFPGNISRRVIWGAESTTRTSLYGYDHT